MRDGIQEEQATAGQPDTSSPKRKKHRKYKIILHSSPFLRCIQTSVAIAAGIAQDPLPLHTSVLDSQDSPSGPILSHPSSPSELQVVTKPRQPEVSNPHIHKPHETRKSILRLDAFLGEWLSPSYFELITPPPGSVMMLAGAKADLLRRENHETYPGSGARPPSQQRLQLWGAGTWSSPNSATSGVASDGLDNMASVSGSLPAAGPSADRPTRTLGTAEPSRSTASKTTGHAYVAPTPHYAISSSSTIPTGYVAHAKDVCVDIDYQWDSSRGPLAWGDGGSFGEEWTSMHQRFRRGIQRLVDWYTTAEEPTNMVTKTTQSAAGPRGDRDSSKQPVGGDNHDPNEDEDENEDEETEAVVIMVSHGAGCNALIGAITHQPVLMDVGTASLTMATRKPGSEVDLSVSGHQAAPSPSDTPSSQAPALVPIHQHYDLKLFANNDHLRSSVPTPVSARTPPIAGSAVQNRGRFSSFSGMNNLPPADGHVSRSSSVSGPLHSMRRPSPTAQPATHGGIWGSNPSAAGGITVGSGVTSFAHRGSPLSLSGTPSVGLWSPIVRRAGGSAVDDDDDNMLPNFSHSRPRSDSASAAPPASSSPSSSTQAEAIASGRGSELSASAPRKPPSPLPGLAGVEEDSAPQPLPATVGGLWSGGPRASGETEQTGDNTTTR